MAERNLVIIRQTDGKCDDRMSVYLKTAHPYKAEAFLNTAAS